MNRRRLLAVHVVGLFGLLAGPLPLNAAEEAPAGRVRVDPSEVPALVSQPPAPAAEERVGDFSHDPSLPRPGEGAEGFDPERSVLLEEETTETQQVWENPDGSRTAVFGEAPARFRDETGEWQEIDLALVEAGGGFAPAASPNAAEARSDADGPVVALQTPAGEVSARYRHEVDGPRSRDAEGSVQDDVVVFEDALPGRRDVTVAWTASGWEESVVLPSASGPAGYVTELSVPEGVTARDVAGAVEFVDADGELFGVFGGGYAHDAKITRSGVGAETEV